MKANELMIGDWVEYRNTIQHWNSRIRSGSGIDANHREYYPIPLTPGILKKNAYPDDGSWYCFGDFYVAHYGDCYVIHQNPNDDKRDFLCRISYVHELQHALRLCGLNDLADNFKVK